MAILFTIAVLVAFGFGVFVGDKTRSLKSSVVNAVNGSTENNGILIKSDTHHCSPPWSWRYSDRISMMYGSDVEKHNLTQDDEWICKECNSVWKLDEVGPKWVKQTPSLIEAAQQSWNAQ